MTEVADAIARTRAWIRAWIAEADTLTHADVLAVCDAAEKWLAWLEFADTATLEQPVTDEELRKFIASKRNWLDNAKAFDALFPEDIRGGWEAMKQELQALLELRELRKQAKADSED